MQAACKCSWLQLMHFVKHSQRSGLHVHMTLKPACTGIS